MFFLKITDIVEINSEVKFKPKKIKSEFLIFFQPKIGGRVVNKRTKYTII
jgi:hypothetical protein